jgi:RimJ/RimL family protein N-acetyltransferase
MRIDLPSEIDGDRVRLRPLRDDDGPAYARAFTDDPDLGRLLGIEKDPDEAAGRGRAARARQFAEDGVAVELAVADPASDAFLGVVLLHSLSEQHRRCEAGFWLAPAARGRGMGTAAVAALCGWAFDALDMLRIELTTTPDNASVPGVARRLGFAHEGVQRKRNVERGERVDIVLYALLREEWSPRVP